MSGPMSLALAESRCALEQTQTQCREDVSKSKFVASRYRSISFFFSTYTKDPVHPDKRAELLVAKEFQDRADLEEKFAASGLKRLAEIEDLKRRMLLLSKELGS